MQGLLASIEKRALQLNGWNECQVRLISTSLKPNGLALSEYKYDSSDCLGRAGQVIVDGNGWVQHDNFDRVQLSVHNNRVND